MSKNREIQVNTRSDLQGRNENISVISAEPINLYAIKSLKLLLVINTIQNKHFYQINVSHDHMYSRVMESV